MIETGFPLTNYEQNEGNEQTPTVGCKDQPSVGISSFPSFCSSFVGKKPTADLLQEWRRGLDRMRGHPPPAGWAERAWRQFKLDAFALLAEHGSQAAALGWRTEELFGVHREHATARVAASGLARFIHGGSVEITNELARIRRPTGAVLTYRRTEPQPGAVPAWELHHREGDNDVDYSMDFDTGAQDIGPWLTWHAAPTRDGAHAAGTWSVKDSDGRATVDLKAGFVFDWPGGKTGWIQAGGVPGVAPRKQWNVSRGRFERQPGDDWKRAMRVPVAYVLNGSPTFAVWEQNSAAAWIGFCDLMVLLKPAAPGELPKLPLVSFTGHRSVKLGNGVTLVPMFKVLRYVPRPLCLPDEDAMVQSPADAWAAPSPARTTSAADSRVAGGNGAAGTVQTDDAPRAGGASGEPLIDDEVPF